MTHLLDEILSQGKMIDACFNFLIKNQKTSLDNIRNYIELHHITKFIFTGMGSSFFCTYIPFYMLRQAGFDVERIEAGEFLLYGFPQSNKEISDDSAIVLVSQSGESGEIVELIKSIQSSKLKPYTISITNDSSSFLATHTDAQLFLNVGIEESVTSKSYTCSLLVLYVLARSLIIHFFDSVTEIEIIKSLITNIKNFLSDNENLGGIFDTIDKEFGNGYQFIQILARGTSMSTASQGALNFKEIVKIKSEATTVSTFRHGGIESLNERTRIILITSNPIENELNIRFIENLISKWAFGTLLYVTNQEMSSEDKLLLNNPKLIVFQHNIENPILAPIMEIIILQLMCYKTALKRGISPGVFNYSSKITNGL